MTTLRELLLAPENAAAYPQERLERIETALQTDGHDDTPWYLRVVIGLGAWLASLFFLSSAITLVGWDHPNHSIIGVMGVVLLIAAVLVGRQKWGLFAEQAALAVSLAAQGMIYAGFLDDSTGGHPLRTAMLIAMALAAILYVTFPGFLSRLMTCFAALQLTLLWIEQGDYGQASRPAVLTALLALGWWAFHLGGIAATLPRPHRALDLKPLGYAFVLSLAAWQMENLFGVWNIVYGPESVADPILWITPNLRTCLLGLMLIAVAAWASGGRDAVRLHVGTFLGIVAGVAALVYLGLAGVMLALLFVLLGFALQERPLLGLGLLLFPAFLAHYYYILELDLLQKSGVLAGSGLVILALRTILLHTVLGNTGGKATP
jgi:uncharacterized membrane protein